MRFAILAAVGVTVSTACCVRAGEEGVTFRLYSSPRGAPLAEMQESVNAGPFPDVVVCLSVGALAIDELNGKNPDKDFMGLCGAGDLLTLRQMSDRVTAIINQRKNP